MGEQKLFAGQAAAVADQGAVLADDAVARNDDGDAVGAVGCSDGPDGARVGEGLRFLLVAHGDTVGDAAQNRPYALLEVGAGGVEGDAEGLAPAGKVFGDFAFGLAGVVVLAGQDVGGHEATEVVLLPLQADGVGEFEQAHAQGAGNDFHGAEGGVEAVQQQRLGMEEAAGARGDGFGCGLTPL